MAQVSYSGQKMAMVDVLNLLYALHPDIPLTTSEAAIFLRTSVTTLERMRKAGDGPEYFQGGSYGAKGTNQSCTYLKKDLIDWRDKNKVSSTMQAAIKKGQTFATIFDLAEHEAYYIDANGNVESMVEENLLGTVVDRIGNWDILWMTPIEAASRRWSGLAAHNEFAGNVQRVLANAQQSIESGIEATDIAESIKDVPKNPTRVLRD